MRIEKSDTLNHFLLTPFNRGLVLFLILTTALFLLSSNQAQAAITYISSTSNPADGNSLGASTVAVTPVGGATAGDLIILVANSRDTSATLAISQTGGQTWTAEDAASITNVTRRIFWTRFNGTWSANPSVSFSGNQTATTVSMHVFRPTSSANMWAIDVAQNNGTFTNASSNVTIAGITTQANGALVFANWASSDNNQWSVQTSGWSNAGSGQYANRDGNDSSQASLYKIMPTAGTTGNVTNAMTSAGTDAGVTSILAFKEISPSTLSIANTSVAEGNSGITNLDFTVSLSAATSSAVTASYVTNSGTATGGASCSGSTDYITNSGTVTIPAGSTTATITVSVCGDTTIESNETLTVQLSSVTNATLGTSTATGTINNDDVAGVASCNSGAISGVINTYYPGTASASAGTTSISVGSSSGASTGLAAGDLVLIMQMQDAAIDTSNTSSYGTTSSINAGKYEYAKVTAFSGSTLTLATALVNSYTHLAGSDSVAQKSFQVIRVPVYSSATLNAGITAKDWDGSSGGVLVFDVVGVLTLNSQTIDVSGKGFRGGGGHNSTSGSGSSSDYRTPAKTNGANGAKGEGIAGTPYRIFDGSTTVNGTVEGYPNGSNARGAPATGGGGGTDGNPTSNDQNSGGGGGGNAGVGGQGGIGWCGAFNANAPPNYGCSNSGGLGGKTTTLSASQLSLGGGGGAGTTNNATGSPGNGVATSGAKGGGIIMIRAGSLSGTATLIADGSAGNSTIVNDGSGGGGAAGAVLISATTGLSGVTISAKGGKGGDNLVPPNNNATPHGPGGGGGGGYVITSGAPASCSVTGGSYGLTYINTTNTPFGPYGATSGSAGSCVSSLNSGSIPGLTLGNGPCTSGTAHYAITYPNGNQKSTCETMTVRITAHDAAHGEVTPPAATQIALSTNISGIATAASWTKKTGGGTFNTSTNVYAFSGAETFAEFNLTRTTITASPHINIDVTDGSKTDLNGDAIEDAKAQFSAASADLYSDNAGTLATIPTLTAGANSNTYYVKVVGLNGSCSSVITGSKTVTMGYQCQDPASCYTTNAPVCGAGNGYLCLTPYNTNVAQTAQALSANNQGSTSSTASIPLIFDANGYAPITFNYLDVGKINLFMTSVGGTTVAGSTNNFLVKPLNFTVIPCKAAVSGDCTSSPADPGTSGGGSTFAKAGEVFKATIKATALGGSTTPSYGLGSSNNTEQVNLSMLRQAPTDTNTRDGNLGGTGTTTGTALYRSNFTNGIVTLSDLTWDEVGVIKLVATNIGFLGDATVTTTGTSSNVGRFYPDHFGLTGSLVTRSDLQTVEGQATPFTYMGEPMLLNVNVTAYSTNESVTQNYIGAYAKLDASTLSNWNGVGCASGNQCFGLGAVEGTTPLSSRLTVMPSPTSTWSLGSGSFTFNLTFARNTSGPDGPFDSLSIGAAPQDTDGVMLRASTSTDTAHALDLDVASGGGVDRRLIATTKMRYGRLRLVNTYGSELLDSRVEVRAEYWNGSRWALNTLDKSLALTTGNVFSSNATGNITTPPTVKSITQFSAGSGGLGYIVFNKTSLPGSFDIALNLNASGSDSSCNVTHGGTASDMPWLKAFWTAPANCNSVAGWAQDPNARVKLGSPKAPYIYLRERY
ncbi:calx-beta domain protein [mine drainage metagenome]|uniref:Calx-beta domain protein n=1 Tax=mine drainage metagenome TaxID=410659 RepID=A0A1J5RXW7_9ZZZZ